MTKPQRQRLVACYPIFRRSQRVIAVRSASGFWSAASSQRRPALSFRGWLSTMMADRHLEREGFLSNGSRGSLRGI